MKKSDLTPKEERGKAGDIAKAAKPVRLAPKPQPKTKGGNKK